MLFSGPGPAARPGLRAPGTWSLGALALLVVLKGLAWAISLASFRGGPTFPAMFLGAAAGVMAAQLPGYDLTPAVAVGIGAGVAAVLRLPLSAVVLALLLTAQSGAGAAPLVIVGVVAAYITTLALNAPRRRSPGRDDGAAGSGRPFRHEHCSQTRPGTTRPAPSTTDVLVVFGISGDLAKR